MKASRSALPLPRYVIRKPTKSGWAHFFNVPSWARKAGCPLRNEPLGTDYETAVARAETVLLPAFDSWRTDGVSDKAPETPAKIGALDWVFSEYRADPRFIKLDARTRRNHESGFRLVGGYVLKDGRRLGTVQVNAINTSVTDSIYEKLLVVTEKNAAGEIVQRERRTTVNHAMKTCRRAWNIAARRNPGKLPIVNPFARMGLEFSIRQTPTATFADLQTFRSKAVELGLPSLATAALIAWEWLQREIDIFGTFGVAHYRPKDQPDAVRVLHEKTREENWVPLFDDSRTPLYPELMTELDAIKRQRIHGLMLRRDWGSQAAWGTEPRPGEIDLTLMSRKVKQIIRAANLPDDLTFASFRHGGFTESGDAELTDREIMAQGRHKSVKVLPRYVKRTTRQVISGAQKRRAARTKAAQVSE